MLLEHPLVLGVVGKGVQQALVGGWSQAVAERLRGGVLVTPMPSNLHVAFQQNSDG